MLLLQLGAFGLAEQHEGREGRPGDLVLVLGGRGGGEGRERDGGGTGGGTGGGRGRGRVHTLVVYSMQSNRKTIVHGFRVRKQKIEARVNCLNR